MATAKCSLLAFELVLCSDEFTRGVGARANVRAMSVCNIGQFIPTLQGFVSIRCEIVASFRKGWSEMVPPPDERAFDEAIAQPSAKEDHDRAERGRLKNRETRPGCGN